MNWVAITRHTAAVAASIVLVIGVVTALAGDAVSWSDRLGMAGFFAVVGVAVVTTVHCHRYQMR